MNLTDITKAEWTTYVGLLTETQKDELVGQLYTDDSYFNPIQDLNDNWVISVEEMEFCTNEDFLWVKDVKYYYKECNYFWLDADGEIFPSTADSCNLWLDELGFLVSYHTGKYGEYAERIKMRINCLYNDVNYELLKMERDRKLYDDKLRSLGVDLSKLDLC